MSDDEMLDSAAQTFSMGLHRGEGSVAGGGSQQQQQGQGVCSRRWHSSRGPSAAAAAAAAAAAKGDASGDFLYLNQLKGKRGAPYWRLAGASPGQREGCQWQRGASEQTALHHFSSGWPAALSISDQLCT